MNILVIDNDTDSLPSLIRLCKDSDMTVTLKHYDSFSDDDIELADAIILSGGIWYDDPTVHAERYSKEVEKILQAQIPVLGICLGMQLMALAFGGELKKLYREQHGLADVVMTKLGQKFFELENLQVKENHTIGVVEAPPAFTVLGRSADCIEIIKHNSKPLLGVQFHPELTENSADYQQFWGAVVAFLKYKHS